MLEEFRQELKSCLQNEPAFCSAACPFPFDIVAWMDKLKQGSFQAAYRLYQNAVAFPEIVSRICEAPCKSACPRLATDAAVALSELERAAVVYARDPRPYQYNLPAKNKKIAIIGGGMSGLACALRLATRGYSVVLYERSDRLGGRALSLLPEELVHGEIRRSFTGVEHTVRLNEEITDLSALSADAVYLATGPSGADFAMTADTGNPYATTTMGVFWGGGLRGRSVVEGIADGLHAADVIEQYLKTGRVEAEPAPSESKIQLDPTRMTPIPLVVAASGELFSREEAVQEAGRCLQCSCDACVYSCDLLRVTGKYPKRVWEDVRITIHPGSLDKDATVAKRFIATCNQCGLCAKVCPQRIDLGRFLRESHRALHRKEAMPWAWHDFWLRDMEFCNGEAALLRPPGEGSCRYLFFPGCQLGAADPFYVTASYSWLRGTEPNTGIMLHCCGAPAEWAGDEELRQGELAKIEAVWQELGQPQIVLACPSCRLVFARYMPELPTVMLYELMAELGLAREGAEEGGMAGGAVELSVFDPCSSRETPAVQQAVRKLAEQAGVKLTPLRMEGELARCCGYGGQVSVASPVYAKKVAQNRVAENELAYLVYCSNCRDVFLGQDKPAYHLLDLLFRPQHLQEKRDLPTVTQRRANRLWLKREILRLEGEEPMSVNEPEVRLLLCEELRRKLDGEKILETDLQQIVEEAEESGRKLVDPQSGVFTAHRVIGNMTFWVEYRQEESAFRLLNAYAHRMRIVEEGSSCD